MIEVGTEYGLANWFNKAKSGDKVLYYDGFLMLDKEKFIQNGGTPDKFPDRIKSAQFAWRLYLDGFLTLVQHKRDSYQYEYIAIKR